LSTRLRLAVAAAVALACVIGIAIVVGHWIAGTPRAPAPLGLRETSAVAPFAGYREVRAAIDGRCVRVVVADTSARRAIGLRGVSDLGAYAGMFFAQGHDSEVAFTMSGVSTPLDVTWYSANGSVVGAAAMRPCPHRAQAGCPVYRSPKPYRFALETPVTQSAEHLAPC
jgi:uncharacterized membrane protein (UPF0127 family)